MSISILCVVLLLMWYSSWFGVAMRKHGHLLIITVPLLTVSTLITIPLLWGAGFFDFNNGRYWPQITYLIMLAIGLRGVLGSPNYKMQTTHNMFTSAVAYVWGWFLFYEGGIFDCF